MPQNLELFNHLCLSALHNLIPTSCRAEFTPAGPGILQVHTRQPRLHRGGPFILHFTITTPTVFAFINGLHNYSSSVAPWWYHCSGLRWGQLSRPRWLAESILAPQNPLSPCHPFYENRPKCWKSFNYKYVHLSILYNAAGYYKHPELTVKGNEYINLGHDHFDGVCVQSLGTAVSAEPSSVLIIFN